MVSTPRRERIEALLGHYADRTSTDLTRAERAARPAALAHARSLERRWVAELDRTVDVPDGDPVAAMRALAARDRLPAVYRWVAEEATLPELVDFLSLEGGPDGGFDDLVATCQVGLSGRAKQEMARNYWDEMGEGDPAEVHTTLYETCVATLGLRALPLADQPVEALERAGLGGLLAGNPQLRPEMVGALGMVELQAGPRCRMVVRGLQRLGQPAAATRFYEVHADVDPRHGRDWLDEVVTPLVAQHPEWGPRILRGAAWRAGLSRAFFAAVTPGRAAAPASATMAA